jgi:hypothetical protein
LIGEVFVFESQQKETAKVGTQKGRERKWPRQEKPFRNFMEDANVFP